MADPSRVFERPDPVRAHWQTPPSDVRSKAYARRARSASRRGTSRSSPVSRRAFPYGTAITEERLEPVDRFEEGLVALGFRQLRVRFHDAVARLELPVEELGRAVERRERIVALGRGCGFPYVALDLAGFRSGSMNEPLVALRRR